MGCGDSKGAKVAEKSSKIPAVLLLGVSAVGKSTILKQIQLAYGQGISTEKRKAVVAVIMDRYIQAMLTILQLAGEHDIDMPDDVFGLGDELTQFRQETATITGEEAKGERWENPANVERVRGLVNRIWSEPGAKEACRRGNLANDDVLLTLNDNDSYFFDNVERVTAPGYLPTDKDMIELRLSTMGVNSIMVENYSEANCSVRLVDVGGQMHERHTWMDEARAAVVIIFIISLSDFDQRTKTSLNTNSNKLRDDSVETLINTITRDELKDTPIIIVFNKVDLFAMKIREGRTVVDQYDKTFTGAPDNVEEGLQFIVDGIVGRIEEHRKKGEVAHYITCAKDADMAKRVFAKAVMLCNSTDMNASLGL